MSDYRIGPTLIQIFKNQAQLKNEETERFDQMKKKSSKVANSNTKYAKEYESKMNDIKSLLHRLVGQFVKT